MHPSELGDCGPKYFDGSMTENVSSRHWTCHTGSSRSTAFQGGILSSFWPSVATYIITINDVNGFIDFTDRKQELGHLHRPGSDPQGFPSQHAHASLGKQQG